MLMKLNLIPLLAFATICLFSVTLAQTQTSGDEESKPAEEETKPNTVRSQSIGSVKRFCNNFPDAPQCKNIDK